MKIKFFVQTLKFVSTKIFFLSIGLKKIPRSEKQFVEAFEVTDI